MKTIYSVPFGADFIDVIKNFVLRDNRELSKTAIIFPGKRPSLYLRKLFAEHFKSPFYSPVFFSIEDFIDYIAKKRYYEYSDIDHADAIWLLYQSVQSLKAFNKDALKQKTFGEFFSWGHYILNFINQLDMENIPDAKLNSLENNAKIGYDIPESINALLINICLLRKAFHLLLEEQKYLTRGLKHLFSLEIIKEIDFTEFEEIYFAGFFALSSVEKALIKYICETGKGKLILEGDPEEWPVLKDFVAYLGYRVEYTEHKGPKNPALSVYTGFDTHSEIVKVREILEKVKSKKTALVLPLSETLFPLLTFSIDMIDTKYNISLGYPLARTSVFDLINGIFDAQFTMRRGNLYSTNSYLQIILHPFIKNLNTQKNMRTFIFHIEKSLVDSKSGVISGKAFIGLAEVESILQGKALTDNNMLKTLKQIHAMFFNEIAEAKNLFEVSEALEKAMVFIIKNTEVRSYVLSSEIFRQIFEYLENLKHAKFSKEILHPDQMENKRIICNFILEELKKINLPFETKPIEDLEIIGVLESRNIAFDTVLILDVNEGIIPQAKNIDPLIPLGIYENLGIPSPEFNEEIYRYYFYRLIKSAKDVHLLYIDAEDRQRSRYIEQIMWEQEKLKKQLDVIPVEHKVYKINLKADKHLPVIKKSNTILEKLKNMIYSPSSIDNYVKCPVLFYYGSILNFEPKRLLTEDIDAMDRGNLIHQILFETFKDLKNRVIDSSQYNEILLKNNEIIDKSFQNKIVTGDYYLFKKLTTYKLESFLKKNINGAPGPFIISHLEETVRCNININNIPLQLKGKIDRVDVPIHEKENIIIDYKTGSARQYPFNILKKTDFNSIEEIHMNIQSFQLPLYVYMFHSMFSVPIKNINAKLILLKNNEEEFLFRDRDGEDRTSALSLYMCGISTVLKDILDITKSFKPFDDELCTTCPFISVCHL